MRTGFLLGFFASVLIAGSPAWASVVLLGDDPCRPIDPSLRGAAMHVRAVDAIAAARLDELAGASTIVREMLAYLEIAQVELTVRSNPSLLRDHRSGGLSRFFVAAGVLNGRLEFDRSQRADSAQRVTLAHELAHAVELAALPRRTTSSLGNQLLAQIGQHDPWSGRLVIETPFARAIDRGVRGELDYGPAPPGTLSSVAKRHRIANIGCAPDRRTADTGDTAVRTRKD